MSLKSEPPISVPPSEIWKVPMETNSWYGERNRDHAASFHPLSDMYHLWLTIITHPRSCRRRRLFWRRGGMFPWWFAAAPFPSTTWRTWKDAASRGCWIPEWPWSFLQKNFFSFRSISKKKTRFFWSRRFTEPPFRSLSQEWVALSQHSFWKLADWTLSSFDRR